MTAPLVVALPSTTLPRQAPSPRPIPAGAILAAQDLFQGRREVFIDFGGTHYRLRITRKNKLILQK